MCSIDLFFLMFIGCILIFPLQYQCPDFVDIIDASGDQITDGQWDRSNLMDRKSEMIANTKVCKLLAVYILRSSKITFL